MSRLLLAPLLPAAAVVVVVAFAADVSSPTSPALAIAVAFVLALMSGALSLCSATRPLGLVWGAAALAGLCCGVRLLIAPPDWSPAFDLRHAGPLDAIRDALARPLARLIPEPESGILLGIVLGERASVGPDLAVAFARSGTSHLLAISGFNMTLVAGAVALALRGRVRPLFCAAITVVAVVGYSVVVGLQPSVLRSALMALVGAVGLASGRRAAASNALCGAVALMLALQPIALGDTGFLLSAGATAGLLLFQSRIAARLAGVRRLPAAIREGLAATLAATVPTLPVIVAVFGRVSIVSPLANLLAVPLFPALMAAGSLTSVAGALSLDLARVPALCAYGVALVLRLIVVTAAALPGSSLTVPSGPVAGIVAAIVETVLVLALPRLISRLVRAPRPRIVRPSFSVGIGRVPPRSLAAAAIGVAAVLALVPIALVAARAEPAVRVRALDVGQGDAYLVESAGHYLLVDGGPDPARLLAELGATLPPWTRRIDVVALTHAHVDHGAGLIAVLQRYEVGMALEPVGLGDVPLTQLWSEQTRKAAVARRAVAAGARVRVGDLRIAVLAPIDDPRVDVPSLVLRAERGQFSILFMGDATDQAQADLLLAPALLPTRVYVPPHHGAASPYAAALVAAVRPEVALISVGAGNRYGHPTAETLDALSGVPVYRTDVDGTVEIDSDDQRLSVRTRANDLPAPRGGSVPYAPAPRRAGRGAALRRPDRDR